MTPPSPTILALLWLLLSNSNAFTALQSSSKHHQHQQQRNNRWSQLRSSSSMEPSTAAPIVISGINIDITPALDEHVYKRIGKALSKFSGAVKECDVVLSVSKNPKVQKPRDIRTVSLFLTYHFRFENFLLLLLVSQIKNGHRVEIVTDIKGTTIICQNQSSDMYESIDLAAHALTRKLVKYKERRNEGYHGGLAMGEDLRAALEALEEPTATTDDQTAKTTSSSNDAFFVYEDEAPYKPTITPVKSFQLDRPISLEEAIFALDYVDHDFYVFRNVDTKEINVVYKRHTGGIGLVAPEPQK
jgi:putative sigma-54 modulation protein